MKKSGNNKAVYGVLLMVFIFFIVLMIFASFTIKAFKMEGDQFSSFSSRSGKNGSIGVVEVSGPIMESRKVIENLLAAEKSKSVEAIIVRVDSPGGAVGPTQEIFEEIRRIDELYNSTNGEEGKPVYVSFGSIAASGGYYIGAAGRKIYANAGALTGSIGVIMQFMDMEKLFEFAKVRPEVMKAGKYKDFGSPNRPLTEEEKNLLNNTLTDVHKQFVNDILKLRKDKIKGNIWDYAQGQVFSGQEALELGLVDEIAGLWEAGRRIHKELGLKKEFGLQFIKKKKKPSLFDYLDNIDESFKKLDFFSKLFTQKNLMFM